jgi:gliding motility-associated-like protein
MIKTIKLFICFSVLCLNAVFGQSAWTSGTWYGPGPFCSGWPYTTPYGGTQVIHNGFVYTASYCTYNRSPSTYCTTCGTPGTYTDWVRGGAVITCNTVRGSVNSSTTVCSGSNSGTLTLSGHNGSIVRWERSTNNWASKVNITNTSTTQGYNNLVNTTKYRAVVKDGTCTQLNSTDVTITVRANLNAGSIASIQTICNNTSPAAFTNSSSPTGGTGSYNYQWQKSTTSAVAGFSNISGANSSTYNESGNLTVNTWYRRRVTSCESKNSTAVKVTVSTNLNAGSIASLQTICYNTSPAAFTNSSAPTGGTGSYSYQWQKSTTSAGAGFSDISGANSSNYNEPGNLTVNTWYRRRVTSGSCGVKNSTAVKVTVRADLNAGSIASGQTICYNTSPAPFTNSSAPTGGTGSYNYQWQKSTTSAVAGFSNISGANFSTYNEPGNLTVNTWYRRTVTSGSCGSKNSTAVKITVRADLNAGSIASGQTICYNTSPTAFTNSSAPTGGTGSYNYQWQKSTTSAGAGFSDISGANSSTYNDPGNLTVNTWYRRTVTSGSCEAENSTAVKVTISPNTVGGNVNSSNDVCSGSNSETLTLSGHTGSIVRWESSTDNFSTITEIVNSTITQDYLNITATTKYRAVVKSGVCSSLNSNNATITVNPLPTINSTANGYRCGSGSVNLEAIVSDGTVNWYDAISGGSLKGSGSPWLTNAVESTTTFYAEAISAQGCLSTVRIPADAVVLTAPIVELGNDTAICSDSTVVFDAVTGVGWAWSNGDNTRETTVNTASDYSVVVTGANGCVGYDTINLVINQLPIVNLGIDTAICIDSTITFDALTGTSWVWNNTDITRFINVNTAGDYDVVVTDANNCVNYDTINLIINQLPIVNLGKDTAICVDSTITFDAVTGTNWTWNNSDITRTTNVNTSGDYDVIVTDANGCVNYDTINLVINQLPIVNLGKDTAICVDSTITFDAVTGENWTWNNSDITRITNVNTSGDYDVVVTDANNCVNYDTINLIINQLPIVNLGKDTAICVDSTITFDAVTGTNWVWNNSDITRATNVNTSGDYDVIVTDANGCVNYDTINLLINQLPVVNLGKDTAICVDSTITFDAVTGENWTWNNTDITRTTTVNTSGDYDVIVTDANNCVNYDTIKLTINQLPIVNLGKDTAICADSTITFNAVIGVNWTWNNADITRTTTVNTSGDYDVVVTDANGCVNYDTINLLINQLPVLNLVSDTSICRENMFILDPESTPNSSSWNRPMQFTWQDGSNDTTFETIGQGVYTVMLKDKFNCVNYDTVRVDTFPTPTPLINVQDTAICLGDSVNLSIATLYNFYAWTNSESFTNTTTVNSTNQYIVRVFDFNGCIGSDTANVIVNMLPNSDIGDSVKLCEFKDLYLEVPENNAQYLWRSDNTTQTQQIHTSGTYWVSVIDTNNCSSSDTVYIYNGEKIPVNLGNDTTICNGTTLTLDASYVHTEIWQSTDSAEVYYAAAADTFDVLVINSEGCYGRDTIIIKVSEIPDVQIIQEDSLPLCELAFEEKIISILNDEGMDIIWNTGETNNEITVTETNSYIVSKTNIYQCTGKDTIEVYEYCRPVTLTMPNIFTPNGDEVNDVFHPLETPLETLDYLMSHTVEISFTVYNRWGAVIYTSNNVLPYWDGLIQNSGIESSQGTYYWILKYADVSGGNYKENGFVELVR